MVERLLEAKAAVDVKSRSRHSLGGGLTSWDIGCGCGEENEDVDGSSVLCFFFALLKESAPVCQNICTNNFCCSSWSRLCRLHLDLLFRNTMKWDIWVGLCSWVGVCLSYFELIHVSLINKSKATCVSTNTMASRHLKTTIFFKSTASLSGQNFQNFDFWGAQNFPKFSQSFLPLEPVGFCLRLGCSSWGKTPLHFAAGGGHESVVKRLLEAKAAVDAKDLDSHGPGGGFGGKPHEAWDRCEEVNEDVDSLSFFLRSRLHRILSHSSIKRTDFKVGLFSIEGFLYGHGLGGPSQSKNCSRASGVFIMMWTHVTAAFLQVSWLEPKFSFPVTPSLALFGQLH